MPMNKKNIDFFNTCVESPKAVKQHLMTAGSHFLNCHPKCVKYVPKQCIAWHFEHERYHRFMYWSSALRSTLNTNVITGLGMCKVCTEAVHLVALWTRTLSQVWACVKLWTPTLSQVHIWGWLLGRVPSNTSRVATAKKTPDCWNANRNKRRASTKKTEPTGCIS